ncbi:MAG: hypothetical protein RLO50_20930 [Azospirillaceae bacterium]
MTNKDRIDESRLTDGTRLYLSGDFGSPAEVLGAPTLDVGQKREILAAWRKEIRGSLPPDREKGESDQPGEGGARDDLLKSIDQALRDLDAQAT